MSGFTSPELNALHDAVMSALTDMRQANDEASKSQDTLIKNRIEAANNEVTKKLAELAEKVRAVETNAARAEELAKMASSKDQKLFADAFVANARSWGVSLDGMTEEQHAQYSSAFATYAKRGYDGLPASLRADMSVGHDPSGGFFVPADSTERIVSKIFDTSPMREICDVATTSSDRVKSLADIQELDSGWVGEIQTRTGTGTPDVFEWEIVIHEQYAEPKTTQKLLDDASVDVGAWLESKVADRFARTENAAFVSGNGVLRPRGFLTYDNGTSWGQVQQLNTGINGNFPSGGNGFDVFADLIGLLQQAYLVNSRWVMNRFTLAAVRKLKDAQGNYLWLAPTGADTPYGTILGYPVTIAEDMPMIATNSLSIAFGDFRSAYKIFDRQGIRVLRDNLTEKGWVKFYSTKRVGGGVVNFDAIKLLAFRA